MRYEWRFWLFRLYGYIPRRLYDFSLRHDVYGHCVSRVEISVLFSHYVIYDIGSRFCGVQTVNLEAVVAEDRAKVTDWVQIGL